MRPNRRTARALFLISAFAAFGASLTGTAWTQRHNTVSFEEGEEGWYPLFDGRSLDGWSIAGNADWQARDGEIVAENGGVSLLLTDETFSDFELKADFLAAPGANSGIFLRVSGKDLALGIKGYEVNIAPPGNPFPTGSLIHVEMAAAGGTPKFGASSKADAGESVEWRTYDVVARGGRITASIDGKPVAELDDPDPILEGYLGLQHNQGKVAFRNVKVKRLKL